MNQVLFNRAFNIFSYLVNRASLSSSFLKLTLRVRPFPSCPMPLFQSKARCGLKVRKSNGLLYITCFYYFQNWNCLMTAFTARESTSSCNQLCSTLRLLPRKLYRRHIFTLIKIIKNHGSCSLH